MSSRPEASKSILGSGGIIPEALSRNFDSGIVVCTMTPVVLHRELASRVPELPMALIESYAASATPEYLDAYSLDDIAEHPRVIRQSGPLPLRLRIGALRPNLFEERIA